MNVYDLCASFPSGFEGGMWDLIVLIPVHCLTINFFIYCIYFRDCVGYWCALLELLRFMADVNS